MRLRKERPEGIEARPTAVSFAPPLLVTEASRQGFRLPVLQYCSALTRINQPLLVCSRIIFTTHAASTQIFERPQKSFHPARNLHAPPRKKSALPLPFQHRRQNRTAPPKISPAPPISNNAALEISPHRFTLDVHRQEICAH